MTAISPLQSIHKKGLFGNHSKKNENELLNISEIKNLFIIQIVQYKNSKIKINNKKIDGLNIPQKNSQVLCSDDTRVLWNAPNTWIVISRNKNILQIIKKDLDENNFAITDISHSRALIQIKGLKTKEVLKKGCPINFHEFKQNNSVGSIFHGINILIDFIDEDSQTFNILTLRSFGESLYHHITDASLEFGYDGV